MPDAAVYSTTAVGSGYRRLLRNLARFEKRKVRTCNRCPALFMEIGGHGWSCHLGNETDGEGCRPVSGKCEKPRNRADYFLFRMLRGLKKGDRVTIAESAEAPRHIGKVWTLLFDPWQLGDGTWVAKIECEATGEYYPSYAVMFLRKAWRTT